MIWSRSRGWIGVDVGTHTVKLAQLERRGGAIQLAEALIVRRSQPWRAGEEGSELDPQASSEEIRAALSLGANFSGRSAAVVLPMAVCDVRECQITEEDGGDYDELVARQLESLYGNAAGSREFGFWPIDLDADRQAPGENLIAFSVGHAWSARIAGDLTRAGLVGQVLDGLPLTLARAVQLGSRGEIEEPVAAVDWGCGRATLVVVLRGHPCFVRCLRGAGFSEVVETLCQTLSVTREEAQKLLTDHGLPNRKLRHCEDLQGVIEEVTAGPFNTFVEQLTRTVTFLRRQRRALSPSKLILFGGGASIKNVSHVLGDKLGLPVEPWQLQYEWSHEAARHRLPIELMGPAIALSSLAWAEA